MKSSHYASLFLISSLLAFASCTGSDADVDFSTSTGETVAGSYARILTVGDYLYAVDQTDIVTYDIVDRRDPKQIDRQQIGFNIETLYHFGGNLFVGSRTAMFTYTIQDDGTPLRRGLFDYSSLPDLIQPCDPVVANETTAYATLYTDIETDSPCGRFRQVQTLVVMDIQNLENPSLVTTLDIATPRGLSLAGDLLYVCNDRNGLSVLDVSDRENPRIIETVTDVLAWDVIVVDDVLVVVGTSEMVQYDISDPTDLIELSRTPLPRA